MLRSSFLRVKGYLIRWPTWIQIQAHIFTENDRWSVFKVGYMLKYCDFNVLEHRYNSLLSWLPVNKDLLILTTISAFKLEISQEIFAVMWYTVTVEIQSKTWQILPSLIATCAVFIFLRVRGEKTKQTTTKKPQHTKFKSKCYKYWKIQSKAA